ncbi:hypothetical protein Q7P37_008126 [Cladosporium fusiforme]
MSPQPSREASEQNHAPSANKRRRIGLACNACRMRKSRCDGQRPSCSSCVSLDFECQYESSESATNVIVRKDYVSDLESRMTHMESKLQRLDDVLRGHLTPCAENHSSSAAAQLPRDDSPQPLNRADADRTLVTDLEEPQDDDAATNGMAMTFIEEHTSAFFGESSNINFTQLLLRAVATARRSSIEVPGTKGHTGSLDDGNLSSIHHSHSKSKAPSTTPAEISITSLPEVAEVHRLLDLYFNSAGVVFPFISEEATRRTYTECLENGFKRTRRTWLGTLNMMFALATMLDRENFPSAKKRFERADLYYQRAVGLCGELSKHVISLETVHYLLMVVLYFQGIQRSMQAWNMHGLLTRSATALGLHCPIARKNLDPIQAEYQRRTWVVIYCTDKVLSAAFGRPASIPDEQAIHLQPSAGLYQDRNRTETDTDIPGDFLAVSFELYQVMSKSLAKQYSAESEQRNNDLDDLNTVQASVEFRNTLRKWAVNLPPYIGLCDSQSGVLTDNSRVNRLRVILTLRYHNLSILVLRPFLSVTIGNLFRKDNDVVSHPPYFVQLAMAEAEECIRSAETTIEIAYAVVTADSTSKNNLGAWYFTLYYASLIITARLLWIQHESIQFDLAAVHHSKKLIKKAETVFQHLDSENSLVLSCWKYIRELAIMCDLRGRTNTREGNSDEQQTSTTAWSDDPSGSVPGTDPFMMMSPDAINTELHQLFGGDTFDLSAFENMTYGNLNGDGMTF